MENRKFWTIFLGVIAALILAVGLAVVVFGAECALMESVSVRFMPPQDAYVLYEVGVMPVPSLLIQEVTYAICTTIAETYALSLEPGGRPVDPIVFPLTVKVNQFVSSGGGGFYAVWRGEVVVKACEKEKKAA